MHPSRESHNSHSVPLGTANGPLVQTAEVNFICSQCGLFYEVAKAKALSDAVERRITCPTCCGPLPAHEAQFTLKYFFWRKSDRGWKQPGVRATTEREASIRVELIRPPPTVGVTGCRRTQTRGRTDGTPKAEGRL